jgi:hypothetical protein
MADLARHAAQSLNQQISLARYIVLNLIVWAVCYLQVLTYLIRQQLTEFLPSLTHDRPEDINIRILALHGSACRLKRLTKKAWPNPIALPKWR